MNKLTDKSNKTVLEVKNISKSFVNYTGQKFFALKDVSFTIKQNDCVLLAGANGSGKSLLMSIIAELEKADSGFVKIYNNEKVSLVFQDAESSIIGETPLEDVSFSLKNNKSKIQNEAEQFLSKAGLKEKANHPSRFLSGGEKRRLNIAGSLALKRNIIIFDEPYANLDYEGVKSVNKIINQLKKNHTIIILTHELEKIIAVCNRFIILHNGEIVFDGTVQKGLEKNLEKWNIKNPLISYKSLKDLVW